MDEKNNDMHCISIRNNNYRVNIRNKQFKVSKTFTQLDKAKEFRDFKLLEYENNIKNEYEIKKNKIEEEEKSIEFSGIQKRGLSWLVQIRNKNEKRISKSFKNLQDAITFRDEYLKKIEEQRIKDIYSLPVTYTDEGISFIELKNKDDTVKCLVDEDNWHFCKTKSLYFDGKYVRITINGKDLQFNRYIYEEFVGPITEDVIDHVNQNKLDNRIQNLEDTSYSVNNYNRTFKSSSLGYKGVYKQKERNKYYASLTKDYKQYSSYGHNTAEYAAIAYNKLALEHYGDRAILNKIIIHETKIVWCEDD